MHWQEFRTLIGLLGISGRSTHKLWSALIAELSATCPATPPNPIDSITQDQFVDLMVPWAPDMLSWAPNVALRTLERKIGTQFTSLAECRQTLRQHGLPSSFELSPERLHEGLSAVGITHCDVDVVLRKAGSVAGLTINSQATFDDVIEAFRSSWQGARVGERDLLEKDGMRVWQQLSDEKHSMHMARSPRHKAVLSTQAQSKRSRSVCDSAGRRGSMGWNAASAAPKSCRSTKSWRSLPALSSQESRSGARAQEQRSLRSPVMACHEDVRMGLPKLVGN